MKSLESVAHNFIPVPLTEEGDEISFHTISEDSWQENMIREGGGSLRKR